MSSNRMFFVSAITTIMLAAAALVKTFMLTTSIAGAERREHMTCCSVECGNKCDSTLALQKKIPGFRPR